MLANWAPAVPAGPTSRATGAPAPAPGAPSANRAARPRPASRKRPVRVWIHGHPLFDSWFDLADIGYQQAEYFVSGTAKDPATGQSAPYTTRIIVTRPSNASHFNGTVLLDWVNVTAQFENAVDTLE